MDIKEIQRIDFLVKHFKKNGQLFLYKKEDMFNDLQTLLKVVHELSPEKIPDFAFDRESNKSW